MIGRTPLARLQWLLRFAVEPEQCVDSGGEVFAFASFGVGEHGLALTLARHSPPMPAGETVLHLAEQVRQGLIALLDGQPWIIEATALKRYVRRRKHDGGFISGYSAEHWEPAFLMRAADLIVEHGARIQPCGRAGCGRLFVRRKGGRYCSKRCSQQERTTRLRRARGEQAWSERRHSAYRRRVERLHGKELAAKVRRRKLLRAARPIRDPLDVLKASLDGATLATLQPGGRV